MRPHWTMAGLFAALLTTAAAGQDEKAIPASLAKEQRDNLLKFLKEHSTPDRYVPKDAKVVDAAPPATDGDIVASKDKPIKQYMVQLTSHRAVPDEPAEAARVDVVYYRPNPVKGKQGITVKYTVDTATGKQVGETEILTKAHTPFSRDELGEALALAKDKAETVQALYKGRETKDVRWEYLQMKINRKSEQYEPGDRVVRFVFTANPVEGQETPPPVRVMVNLTKDLVIKDDR